MNINTVILMILSRDRNTDKGTYILLIASNLKARPREKRCTDTQTNTQTNRCGNRQQKRHTGVETKPYNLEKKDR